MTVFFTSYFRLPLLKALRSLSRDAGGEADDTNEVIRLLPLAVLEEYASCKCGITYT